MGKILNIVNLHLNHLIDIYLLPFGSRIGHLISLVWEKEAILPFSFCFTQRDATASEKSFFLFILPCKTEFQLLLSYFLLVSDSFCWGFH